MFYGCSNLDYVKKLPKGLKDAQGMFGACYNLKKFTKEFQIPDKAVTTVMFWAREGELHPTWVPAANKSLVNYPNWGSEGRGIILYCTVSLRDSERKLLKEVDVRYGDEFKKEQLPQAPKGYHWILPDLSELNQVEKDLTVTLQKEKEEYTVKFQDWNGKLLNEQKVGFEEAAKEPKAPARAGYTFTGWDKSFNKITGEITVTAKYSRNPAKADSTPHYNAQSKKPGVESLNRKLPLTKAVKSGRLIKVRWKKKKGAKGYVIYYSTKKKGKIQKRLLL